MKFELLKDRYDFELGRKDALTGALTLPVAVLTGLGGTLAAMARSFSYTNPRLTGWFAVLMIADIVVLIMCAGLFARAYHAQTYEYLPLLADLEQAQMEFHEFNRYVEDNGGQVEEDFSRHLRERIIHAADANTQSNDRRSKWMHWGRIALFGALASTALVAFPYVTDQVQQKQKAMTQDNKTPAQSSPASGASQSTTPTAVPQKPTFPANRIIREGQEPTSDRAGTPNSGTGNRGKQKD